jgi:NitT/TauT family transport system substrate-binding protein
MKRGILKASVVFLGLVLWTSGELGETAWAKDTIRVAEGPFISGGATYIAKDKGYFEKMGLEVVIRRFDDGSLAVPSIIAGELDITFMPAAANLFNAIAKGAPLIVFLDRGNNHPGRAYSAINVSQNLYEQGVHGLANFGKLKGKKVGVGALGSINQYTLSLGLIRAGLEPANDVQWIVNIPQPDLIRMLGRQQVDAIDVGYNFSMLAQDNKWGPLVATGDEVAAGGQIATYAVRTDYLARQRDVVVRWVVAYLQAAKEFNAAAADPDKHPDIVSILAKNTVLNKPELVKAIAPNWSYINENGNPNVESVMEMQDFWSGPYFKFVEKKVSREQLFDLTIAKEAKERLERERPFGP